MTTPTRTAEPNRLPFRLHDFTRRQWTTPTARAVWEPRLHAIGRAWVEIERHSVAAGIRSAHLTSLAPEAMPDAASWAARNGVALVPLTRNARPAEYSQSARAAQPGEAWDFRVAYVRHDAAADWLDAWGRGDDARLGELLGYPACCRAFFGSTWVAREAIDPTPYMTGTDDDDPDGTDRNVRNPDPHAMILGRWAGYRAVPHMPCAFDCAPTIEFGRALTHVGHGLGFVHEMGWLMEALSWPYEWHALHGIAEIRSPILRITTRTDATRAPRIIRVHSDNYPPEGAKGTRHPYRTWRERRAPAPAPPPLVPLRVRSRSARLNGFKDDAAMKRAHGVLERVALDAAEALGPVRTILDLGCGDGTLLARLGEALGADSLRGVEVDPDRAAGAVDGVDVVCGSIADLGSWEGSFDLIVLMPGRATEMPDGDAAAFVDAVKTRARAVLLYGYGDWLERFGGLSPLVRATFPEAGSMLTRAVESCASAGVYIVGESPDDDVP